MGEERARSALNTTWNMLLAEQQRNDKLIAMLKEILDCPHGVDQATIPKAGIEAAPEQVVLNYSIGLARIRKARALLEEVGDSNG